MADNEAIIETSIVPASQMQLGSLPIRNPKDLVAKATDMADALASIITQQNLFKTINGRKYVMVEGWTTLGAMMGVVPVEEYCKPLPLDNEGLVTGFEAKVRLIRASDGGTVGAASAECTYEERNWSDRDSYALRSMSITRATGKAYRLSFSWIMKLAGFEPTPAEEMDGVGSKEVAQKVATRKLKEAAEDAKASETVEMTPYKDEFLVLTGAGVPIVMANLDNKVKAALGFRWEGNKPMIGLAHGHEFEDLCRKHEVGTIWMDSQKKASDGPVKAKLPPMFDAPPSNGGSQSTDPVILSAERIKSKKPGGKEFLKVNWGGKLASCWDKKFWPHLEHYVKRPAALTVEVKGQYANIVGIESLDGVEFFDEPVDVEDVDTTY